MEPTLDADDPSLAVEIAVPPDDGWPGGMGCHDRPVRAWRLPATTGDWRLVAWETMCECCGGGDLQGHYTLQLDDREWIVPGSVVVEPDRLVVHAVMVQAGRYRSEDTMVVDLRSGIVDADRVVTRITRHGATGAHRSWHQRWTLEARGLEWPLYEVPKRWR